MVRLSAKHFRIIQALLCVIVLHMMVVGPGVLKAEQLGCEFECLLKRVSAEPASCCAESSAVHDMSHSCDTEQQAYPNSVPDCCEGGPCYGSPLDFRETAAVSTTSVETESSKIVLPPSLSTGPSDQFPGWSIVRQVSSGTTIPIYIRTCVFLI